MAQRFENEIKLNRIAQGHMSMRSGIDWFEAESEVTQRELLRLLAYMALQAGATDEDVESAISRSGLKSTHTPCVLLLAGRLKIQFSKVVQLPTDELAKSFRLLLSLFSIADERRRVRCNGRCRHWWHRDLGDEKTVESIRSEHRQGIL